MSVEERIVTTDDGAELAVTVVGEAPTEAGTSEPVIVLAHGWTNARSIWDPVVERLREARHRVVLYDQRGHGQSSFGSQRPTAARLGDDLATVLGQLDLDDVVLGGHSMGGFAVMAYAGDHLDDLHGRVRGLGLFSTAAHGLGLGRLDLLAAWLVGSPTMSRALMRPRFGLFMVRGAAGRRPRSGTVSTTRQQFLATDPAVRRACYQQFGAIDLRPGLADVKVPTVVVTGSRDLLTPPRRGRAVAERIPGARFELVPGAGHMLPLESPDILARSLAGLSGPTPTHRPG